MALGIITSIQQSNAYQNFVVGSAPERWAGRIVEIIGAASLAVSPYFQRKPVAIVALVVCNVISLCFAALCVVGAEKLWKSKEQKNKSESLSLVIYLGTYVGGVIAFSKFTQLPLGKLVNTAVSVVTFVGMFFSVI
jgi:hypothetical protein